MPRSGGTSRRTGPSGPGLFDELGLPAPPKAKGASEVEYRGDPDGLPAECIKPHTQQKYDVIRFYVEICGATRRTWVKDYGAAATYIDLFSGPGRAYENATGNFCDASPLIAWEASRAGRTAQPFTHVFIADAEPALADAAATRLKSRGANVMREHGKAEATVDVLVRNLPPGFHFALLDPYSLNAIPFDAISKLANVEHLDMLIHFSEFDLTRNLGFNVDGSQDWLDRVVPKWRDVYDPKASAEVNRAAILQSWCDSIAALGKSVRGITGVSARSRIQYHLVLFSGHTLAGKFWDEMERRWPEQRPLFGA